MLLVWEAVGMLAALAKVEGLEQRSLLLALDCFCLVLWFYQKAVCFAPFSLSVAVGFLFNRNFAFVAKAASRAGPSEEV